MTSMLVPESQTAPISVGSNVEKGYDLGYRVRQIQESIARRAYELFEERDHRHGNSARQPVFKIVSEILLPISREGVLEIEVPKLSISRCGYGMD